MTLTDMHTCTRPYLTAKDVAGVLGCDPHSLRRQAHSDPQALGYPVIVIGRRVHIPRLPFLAYMEGCVMSNGARKAPPGVMLYYDLVPCLDGFSDSDLGALFRAVLQYGSTGEVPSFGGSLLVAWAFIRPRIDRDAEQYVLKAKKARYAAYVREEKARGHTALPYDEWSIDDTIRSLPPVCGR